MRCAGSPATWAFTRFLLFWTPVGGHCIFVREQQLVAWLSHTPGLGHGPECTAGISFSYTKLCVFFLFGRQIDQTTATFELGRLSLFSSRSGYLEFLFLFLTVGPESYWWKTEGLVALNFFMP